MRPERTVSVPREGRGHRPGVGGRRMDRGLVTFPHVWGFGSGRQDPGVTGQVLQWRVRNPVPEKSPSRPGPGDGHGPHWVAARSPARQAPDLPGHPDFLRVLLWFRGRLAVRGWFGRTPSRDSLPFPGPYGHPFNFRIQAVQSSAQKPSRNDDSSSGLAAFWFLWPAGGSVPPQCRRAGFPSALRTLIT